ncbi:hypothetical protein BgiBS90_004893, partial [Biomphalaria glabrata]
NKNIISSCSSTIEGGPSTEVDLVQACNEIVSEKVYRVYANEYTFGGNVFKNIFCALCNL